MSKFHWYDNSSGEESMSIKGIGTIYTCVLIGGLYGTGRSRSEYSIHRCFPEIIAHTEGYERVHTVYDDPENYIKWCEEDYESGRWGEAKIQAVNQVKTKDVIES